MQKGSDIMIFIATLISVSLVMSVIMALLWGFSPFARKSLTAKTRYFIWIILILGLIIPFRPIFGDGLITLKDMPKSVNSNKVESIENAPITENSTSHQSLEPTNYNIANSDVSSTSSDEPFSPVKDKKLPVGLILTSIWLLGAVIVFSKKMHEYRKFRKLLNRWGQPVKDAGVNEIFKAVKHKMGLEDKTIKLIQLDFINSPMLTGFLNPTIILPGRNLEDDELELVFEHELTHYKHKDLFINFLGIVAISIHWFNPILYICFPKIYEDSESYCDEDILKTKDVEYRRFYGEAIIGLMETSFTKAPVLSTSFCANKSNLKRRLLNIMEIRRKNRKLSITSIAVILCLTLISGSIIVFANTINGKSDRTIGLAKAKSIALNDAGLQEKNVSFVKAKIDFDNGMKVYDVEFYSNGKEYDYEIHAVSGRILEKDMDIENYTIPKKATKPAPPVNPSVTAPSQVPGQVPGQVSTPNNNVQSNNTPNVSAKASGIGIEKAKLIAFRHAGLNAGSVRFIKAHSDMENGRLVYDVEFYSQNKEYSYEIDAATGRILDYDVDYDSDFDNDDDFDLDD